MRKVTNPFNCRPFGQAVKDARTKLGLSRRKVEETHNIDARYLLAIENKGQHTSLQVFYELATIFNVSVDQFFFPDKQASKDSTRIRIENLLDSLDSRELAIVEATLQGIHNSRRIEDE